MAYGLKYYKIIKVKHGTVELDILQRDYTASQGIEIAYLQGLSLMIDGDDEPTNAITKTLATITLADADDQEDTQEKKFGGWYEFYTPDDTLYMVQILYNGEIIWSGYITTDNWEESLDYRGSITITARDNIGHLADYNYDDYPVQERAYGLVSVSDIIFDSMHLISMPMTFNDNVTYYGDLTNDQQEEFGSLMVNTEMLSGKTRYEVLEMALSSLGLVIRYTGFNTVICDHLRYMPYNSADRSEIPAESIMFINGSGTLRKMPAYKRIVETIAFDIIDKNEFDSALRSGTQTNERYTAQIVSDDGLAKSTIPSSPAISIPTPLTSAIGLWSGKGMINAASYTDGAGNVFLAANSTTVSMEQVLSLGAVSSLYFGVEVQLDKSAYTLSGGARFAELQDTYIKELKYVLYIVNQNNPTDIYAYEGGWTSTEHEHKLTADEGDDGISINVPPTLWPDGYVDYGNAFLKITGITFGAKSSNASVYIINNACKGIYARIKSTAIVANEAMNKVDKDTVTTIVNDRRNTTSNISPELGFLTRYSSYVPQAFVYKNIFYAYNEDAVIAPANIYYQWGTTGQYQPVVSIKHKQMLMYHYTDENVLEGDVLYSGAADIMLDRKMLYKGTEYMIIRGTLDLLSGVLEGARLVSFQRYEDLWDD